MIKKVLLTLFISAMLTSCDTKRETRDLSQNTIIAHILSQPDGLHPFNNNSVMRSYIFNYTQKTLIKLDLRTLDYIPDLVKEMPIASEDNLSFDYELKKGILWDDGSELTAEDVAFSVKLMLCPLTNNTQIRSNYSTVIKSIEIDPTNPMKFTMHAQKKHWENKYIFSDLYMVQKSLWDPKGVLDNVTFADLLSENFKETEVLSDFFNSYNNADNSFNPDLLVGLGAYKVSEWVKNQYITIEKKKNWWGANDTSVYNRAYPDKIIFKIISEDASTYLALKNQEIDVTTEISTNNLIKLKKLDYFNENYESDFLDQYSFSYMGLNMKPDGIKQKLFFTDQKVRRAMAYMIPVDEIIEVMMHGKASRQASLISPLQKAYNDTLKLIPLDIEKAKELLTQAGWVDTDGDNIRDKIINGVKTPFSFKLSYMSSPISTEIVLVIKESMYKAGVVAEPTPMDFSLFYKNAADHNFDAMLGGWGGSASYSNPMQLWHTSSWATKGSNFCGFGDAESDALIEEANHTLDPEINHNALLKLQAKVYNDQPYVFLYATKRKFAIHKRFNNISMYNERPGIMLQNLDLKPEYGTKNMAPTNN
jgi:peptide/nickel transport system substrate-binding protein